MDAVDPALTDAVERAAQQPGVEEVSSLGHGIFQAVPKILDVTVHVDPCTHAVADPHSITRQHLPNTPRGVGAPPAGPGDRHNH